MENGPTNTSTSPSFESSTARAEKKDTETTKSKDKNKEETKPASQPEAVKTVKQRQVERDIARSLDKFSSFEKRPEKSKAEKLETKVAATKDGLQAPEMANETDAPIEHWSPAEKSRVAQELAAGHLSEFEPTSDTVAEVDQEIPEATDNDQPDQKFLKKVVEGFDIETAFTEAAMESGISEAAIEAALKIPIDAAGEGSINDEPIIELDPDNEAAPEPADVQTGNEITIDHSDNGAEADEADTVAAAGAGGANGGTGSGQGSNNGAGTPPPPGSTNGPIPAGAAGYHPGAGFNAGATNPNAGYNVVNPGPNPNLISIEDAHYNERRALQRGVVSGGIVGYLLGRRRGRIKTEKRLLPIQKQLTREVTKLEQNLTFKEQQLRSLSSEATRVRMTQKTEQPLAFAEKAELASRLLPVAEQPLHRRDTSSVERAQAKRPETRLGLEKPARAERLGHMVMATQTPERAARYIRPNNIREAFRAEDVKTMHRRELLEVSEKIQIEGASLRHIYESHLIGEQQLRHLVGEYLDGKDIRRDLRKEMVEREIDFERDPIMRDRVRSKLTSTSNTTLNQLLEKAGALPDDDQESTHRAKAQAEHDQAKVAKHIRNRQLADAGMVTAIIILGALVAVLLFH